VVCTSDEAGVDGKIIPYQAGLLKRAFYPLNWGIERSASALIAG